MVQQPARRITRFLGIRKGTIASGYSQLYISFALSCLFHQFQMFNVTRHDTGEFVFFMTQPVAITVESLIESIWRRCRRSPSIRGPVYSTGMILGYIWVILWFSWCLPIYVKGLRDADIIRDALLDTRPFNAGAAIGHHLIRHITSS